MERPGTLNNKILFLVLFSVLITISTFGQRNLNFHAGLILTSHSDSSLYSNTEMDILRPGFMFSIGAFKYSKRFCNNPYISFQTKTIGGQVGDVGKFKVTYHTLDIYPLNFRGYFSLNKDKLRLQSNSLKPFFWEVGAHIGLIPWQTSKTDYYGVDNSDIKYFDDIHLGLQLGIGHLKQFSNGAFLDYGVRLDGSLVLNFSPGSVIFYCGYSFKSRKR